MLALPEVERARADKFEEELLSTPSCQCSSLESASAFQATHNDVGPEIEGLLSESGAGAEGWVRPDGVGRRRSSALFVGRRQRENGVRGREK